MYGYGKKLTRWNTSLMKVGACGVCISRCLKQNLTWAIDKQFWFISSVILFKTVIYTAKELTVAEGKLCFKQINIVSIATVYVVLSNYVANNNYVIAGFDFFST